MEEYSSGIRYNAGLSGRVLSQCYGANATNKARSIIFRCWLLFSVKEQVVFWRTRGENVSKYIMKT